MKQYLLLSNNQQSGPYSLEELRAKNLRPLDLVWIEQQSLCWEYAGEVTELKEFVKEPPKPKFTRPAPVTSPVYVSMPSNGEKLKMKEPMIHRKDFMATEKPDLLPPVALKERDPLPNNRPVWDRQFFRGNELLKLVAVFSGVILGAMLMKKAADGLVAAPPPEAINQAQVMIQPEPEETKTYQEALVRETVTPTDPKPVIRSVKPKDIRAQVRVKAGKYKTGVLGGISNLELTAVNASPHFIDRLTVSVDYLRKNGELIETKKHTVQSLAPGSSKIIKVPPHRRGMKVRISVQQIYSKEYTAALKQA